MNVPTRTINANTNITNGLHERVNDRLALELLHKIIPELLDVISHP